jgi:hypothetical protein
MPRFCLNAELHLRVSAIVACSSVAGTVSPLRLWVQAKELLAVLCGHVARTATPSSRRAAVSSSSSSNEFF